LPENKYYIFGKDGGKELAKSFSVPFLGEIPIVQSIGEGGDKGVPAALDRANKVAISFAEIAGKVAQQIAINNAQTTGDLSLTV
jgi:ATP-binding protein involved in chromosome partitioning